MNVSATPDNPDELRPIPGWEGEYSVTRDGRVWSHAKKPPEGGQGRTHEGRWMKAGPNSRSKKPQLKLARNRYQYTVTVERLVRLAWPPEQDGPSPVDAAAPAG